MATRAERLRARLAKYKAEDPESRELTLQLDFARIVMSKLDELGWSQRQLARQCEMEESFISRVIHSDENLTLTTISRILFALGVEGRLTERSQSPREAVVGETEPHGVLVFLAGYEHGEEEISYKTTGRGKKQFQAWSQVPASGSTGQIRRITTSTRPDFEIAMG